MRFTNREEAGRKLAPRLRHLRKEHPLLLALPRGGVVVAHEIAQALDVPVEVLAVRKLGAPGQPEFAIGAIAEGGGVFVDVDSAESIGISSDEIAEIAERESVELTRRAHLYRRGSGLPPMAGRTVVLVDDGIATGATARAAIRAVRALAPRKLVLAAPVVAGSTAEEIAREVDEFVYLDAPEPFVAVGLWYEEFPQVGDAEVLALLGRGDAAAAADPPVEAKEVSVPCDEGRLEGLLAVPAAPWGLVIFAHGSGSSRHSPRNQHVARVLQYAGLATLLVDLLTPAEEAEDQLTARPRFDIDLLADRLVAATLWTDSVPLLRDLPIGYFGASTGAAAAMVAAAGQPPRLRAIVSRGGRPDLAGPTNLVRVEVPVLLLVGSRDPTVIDLNREAMRYMTSAERRLAVVPGATHLFEEPGTLDSVARLAADWFGKHLLPIEAHPWPEGRPA